MKKRKQHSFIPRARRSVVTASSACAMLMFAYGQTVLPPADSDGASENDGTRDLAAESGGVATTTQGESDTLPPELAPAPPGGRKPSLVEAQVLANRRATAEAQQPLAAEKRPLFRYNPGLTNAYSASGQDVIRPSIVGLRSTLEREPARQLERYNLRLGPFRMAFEAGVGFEFNDNINYSSGDGSSGDEKQSDFIIRPHIGARLAWDVTELNTLRVDFGLSYAKYLDHSEYDTSGILITPGSQISFDIYVGDVRINLHDRFAIQQDPVDEPTLNDVADFGRFTNTAGISLRWDLNDIQLTASYDHFTYRSLNSQFDYLDRDADSVSFSAAFNVREALTLGVEGGGAFTYYKQDTFLGDSTSYHVGLFADAMLTPYLRARAAAGLQGIHFSGTEFSSSDEWGWYANATLVHKIGSFATQTLEFGHETQLGIFANTLELEYVRHTVAWNVIRNLTVSTDLLFESGRESGGPSPEDFQRYGARLSLGHPITRKLFASLRYQFLYKDSNRADRDYAQNQVILDLTYQF